MKKLYVASLFVVALAACGNKAPSCDKVYDHVRELVPAEQRAELDKQKDSLLADCEKETAEGRQCALDAKSLDDAAKCEDKGKKE